MGTGDAIQESNPDEVDITKIPSLPSRVENEDHHSLLYDEKAQPSQRVPRIQISKGLSEVLTTPPSTDESQFQAKVFWKQTI